MKEENYKRATEIKHRLSQLADFQKNISDLNSSKRNQLQGVFITENGMGTYHKVTDDESRIRLVLSLLESENQKEIECLNVEFENL